MSEHKLKTCGSVIQEARIMKNMSAQDLTNEINKQKKRGEKDIDVQTVIDWESSKAYPELEMCYKLAFVLELNPTEILGLRNFERKKFKVKKTKRTFFNQDIPDEFFWFMKGLLSLACIMLAFYAVFKLKTMEASYYGSDIKLEQEYANKIDEKTNFVENENKYDNLVD